MLKDITNFSNLNFFEWFLISAIHASTFDCYVMLLTLSSVNFFLQSVQLFLYGQDETKYFVMWSKTSFCRPLLCIMRGRCWVSSSMTYGRRSAGFIFIFILPVEQ